MKLKLPEGICFILLLLLLTVTQNLFADNRLEKRLTIVYTNSLNGNFDYCHCKEDPKGGLVKRATEIKNIRKSYKNVILFDTGDSFTVDPDRLLAKYLIKAFKYISYDSVIFGDQELAGGIDEFLQYQKDLPFICNNIQLKIGKKWENPFNRFRIIEKNNIKVGVIGSISKEAFKYYPKSITENIRVIDQKKEIESDIKRLKQKRVDLIVLLSHSGYEEDIELSKKIKGIGIILGGHSQTFVKKPVRSANTIIAQAGPNGAHIGILEIALKNNKIKIIKNSFRLPDEFQPEDDKYIRDLINKYHDEIKKEYKNIKFK